MCVASGLCPRLIFVKHPGLTSEMGSESRLRVYTPRQITPVCALIIGLLVFLVQFACTNSPRSSSTIRIETEITPQPVRVGSATFKFTMSDAEGKPVSGARVRLEGNMTHPGMKPEFADAKELAPGQYEAALEFTMAGDWIIMLHATLQSGEKLERQVAVRGVRPN